MARDIPSLPGRVPAERAIKGQPGNFQSALSGRIHPVLTPSITGPDGRGITHPDTGGAKGAVLQAWIEEDGRKMGRPSGPRARVQ